MDIEDKLLASIEADEQKFVSVFRSYAEDVFRQCRLYPRLLMPRMIESHGAWRNDLQRVGGHEPELEEGLDHYKRCGHLTFWLRRMSPVIEAVDLTGSISDAPGYPLSEDEKAFRELLFGYAKEYLAFDFGYQFCLFYEQGSPRAECMRLSEEYLWTMCHFLKYKTVSPHALFLIFKSLFLK